MEEIRFISYLDDNGKVVHGNFNILDTNTAFVTFLSNDNAISIPVHRILKIKKSIKEVNDKK